MIHSNPALVSIEELVLWYELNKWAPFSHFVSLSDLRPEQVTTYLCNNVFFSFGEGQHAVCWVAFRERRNRLYPGSAVWTKWPSQRLVLLRRQETMRMTQVPWHSLSRRSIAVLECYVCSACFYMSWEDRSSIKREMLCLVFCFV